MASSEVSRCPFCGLRVESPCDEPPPTLCPTASEHLLRRTLPTLRLYGGLDAPIVTDIDRVLGLQWTKT